MIRPVEGSELAAQVERARQRIERWPEWLKDAAGVGGKEDLRSPSSQQQPNGSARLSVSDFID
jgi:hypothetical protein